MAFSNTWDTTFPPDTQLANLLGQDIRNGVKVDVQQRMAAISGLDAAKPSFGSDAQPANWNGVLFFATDTGKIYQFNNPAWTDITANFAFRNPAIKNITVVTQTGDTAPHTIYTMAIPAGYLGTTGHLRITLAMLINASGGSPTVLINYAGNGISVAQTISSGRTGNASIVVLGGNLGATNSQSWDTLEYPAVGNAVNFSSVGHRASAADSTVSQNLTVVFTGGANADSITFYRCIVELL